MAGILFLTNMQRHGAMMEQARLERASAQVPGRVMDLRGDELPLGELETLVKEYSPVVISWMGQNRLDSLLVGIRKRQGKYVLLPSDISLEPEYCGFDAGEVWRLRSYLIHGGLENFRLFWQWLEWKRTGRGEQPPPAAEMPWCGLVDLATGESMESPEEFRARCLQPGLPAAALVFSRDEWIWQDLGYHRAMAAKLKQRGIETLPFFSYRASEPERGIGGLAEAIRRFCFIDGQLAVQALIVTMKFSLTLGSGVTPDMLKGLDIPVLQAYTMAQPAAVWENGKTGCSAWEVASGIALPEYDGVIHTVPIAAKEEGGENGASYLPIEERLERLAGRTAAWIRLKRLDNAEKKIAIVFHNYPPSNASIGNAAGLDSPESVLRLLRRLQAEGYRTGELPPDSKSLMAALINAGTNDRDMLTEGQLTAMEGHSPAAYTRLLEDKPPVVGEELAAAWGPAPGDLMVQDEQFRVPGIRLGNIWVTVQPPRGFSHDPAKIYHSPDAPPTHHYLACYHWLQTVLAADAVVHVGTHGSLEWLPGKSTGLGAGCYPDIAIGDLPNLYPYLVTIVGEGTQAKRRAGAVLIGHMSPALVRAELYEGLAEMERLLDEARDSMQLQPAQRTMLERNIREKAAALHLDDEAPPEPGEDWDDYAGRLHAYLDRLAGMDISDGLHILGQEPARESLRDYIAALTRTATREAPSLPVCVASLCGWDYDRLLPGRQTEDEWGRSAAWREVARKSGEFLAVLDRQNYRWPEAGPLATELPWVAAGPEAARDALLQTGRWICEDLVNRLRKTGQEMDNLLAGLAGRYVEPGPAGAVTSGMPEILPTGRNFYSLDPRTLPTPTGWEAGMKLAEQLIERFIIDEGRYPESIGMVLWGGANMRSRGQCIAEFLALLGVRPVWQKGSGRVTDVAVIPPEELKRPRIDVTARISGLFRDMVPDAATLMDKAVKLVRELEEPLDRNYIRKHILAETAELEAEGLDEEKARRQAGLRVFGCPPGDYGAGVAALLEARNWETAADLAQVYVRWGAYAYGEDAAGEYLPERFSRRLSGLDLTVKNEDNREINILASDDFNAYHGGMAAAVRGLSGRSPRSYVGDSSDRSRVAVRSLEEEFRQLYRAQVVNPKYIAAMQRHGYKGAADLAAQAAHCYDWDATSEVMTDWMYEGLAEKYALDPAMQEWLKEVNPWALKRIAEKLLEAARRAMWSPQPATLEALTRTFLDIEGELEERGDG